MSFLGDHDSLHGIHAFNLLTLHEAWWLYKTLVHMSEGGGGAGEEHHDFLIHCDKGFETLTDGIACD